MIIKKGLKQNLAINTHTLFAFQDELVDRLLSIKDQIFLRH
jgi:hypothetical protein